MSGSPTPDDDTQGGTARGKIAAVIVLLALLAAGWWLSHRLGSVAALQDCIATGRHDCG